MARLFRIPVIWLVALSMIASGAVLQPCAIAQGAQPEITGHELPKNDEGMHAHAMHASAVHAPALHDHAGKAEPIGIRHPSVSVIDHAKAPIDNHGCQKCCGVCALTSIAPLDTASSVVRTSSDVTFPSASSARRDWHVQLEPEIPKSLI